MTNKNSIFSEFTNLYSLTKTLRFELKPTEETKQLLAKTNNLGLTPVQKDKDIDKLYHETMKPMFDELHEKFINESLQAVELNIDILRELEGLNNEYRKLAKNKKDNKQKLDSLQKVENGKFTGLIPDLQAKLKKVIEKKYEQVSENWKKKYLIKDKIFLKEKSYKILTESASLKLLQLVYPDFSKIIEDNFIGFHGYFTGFNQNRKNYYTNEGKVTEVTFRCINVNLMKFLDNRIIFEIAKNKITELSKYNDKFQLSSFQNYLFQDGIENFNEIVSEVKSTLNKYFQDNRVVKKEQIRGFVKLHKQIGCKTKQQKALLESGEDLYPEYLVKVGLGFKIKKIEKNYQIWEAVDALEIQLDDKIKSLKLSYKDFFENCNTNDYDLSKIWFRKEALNTISGRWFGGSNWSLLGKVLSFNGVGKVEAGEYKIPQFINLEEIKESLDMLENGVELDLTNGRLKANTENLINYSNENIFLERYKETFKGSIFETFLAIWKSEIDTKFKEIENYKKIFNTTKTQKFDKEIKDENDASLHVKIVKNLVEDGYLRLLQFTKYHSLDKKGEPVAGYEPDGNFYEELINFWGDETSQNNIILYHKALQSSLTEKPFETDKIKLNFECGTLLNGWSAEYNSNGCLIFKKDKQYYLGIINGTKFSNNEIYSLSENITEINKGQKFDYLTQKIDNANVPRVFIRSVKAKNGKPDKYPPVVTQKLVDPSSIMSIYENGTFKKDAKERFDKSHLIDIIDYFKTCFKVHPDFKNFSYNWNASKDYENIADFYSHTAEMCYETDWGKINFHALEQLVKNDRIYLFEITNKDLKPKKSGDKKYNANLHTTLFLEMLKPENAKKIKLLGGGEIFYRDKSLSTKIDIKRSKNLEIIESKRYTDKKYFLHFPVQLSGNKKDSLKDLLQKQLYQHLEQVTYLGLDRGEKHLVYYCLIDYQGRIIKQGSFNKLLVAGSEIDFQVKLTTKSGNRDKARKDWETIGNIKNFKEGYLSQVIHEVYKIVIENDALVILENLNTEFKAKRTSMVEKAVYKKFELALAKKLNHLVLKDKKPEEKGGVLNAYQLTPIIGSGDIGNYEKSSEWGIIKKVQAAYTSAVDPLTRWRKHKYISNSASILEIQKFFEPNNVAISWDEDFNSWRFDYNQEIKDAKGKEVINLIPWTLHAHPNMVRFRRDPLYQDSVTNTKGKTLPYNLSEKLDSLFISIDKNGNIYEQIKEIFDDKNWKSLVFYWNLINQIRNTDEDLIDDSADFIQSPVWSKELGDFFDSREVSKNKYSAYEDKYGKLPTNGDANGAYHIAKRGMESINKLI
jgi:hypothetical protein